MMAYRYSANRRWGDNDRFLGPFTYAHDGSYPHIAIILKAHCADDGGEHGVSLRLSFFSRTLIISMPPFIMPWREKVTPTSWDAATIARLGRDWYWNEEPKEYGFSYSEGYLGVSYGRQSHDSSTEKRWGYFLPWTQWRHVRHSVYDLQGALFADIPQRQRGARLGDPGFYNHWEAGRALQEACPSVSFPFADFDGQRLNVTTRIEEREWLFGEKWCKWLSLFRKPKIRRSLDLAFSGETGERKGSWKGGTTGHAIDLLPGELHESAFRRYCAEHAMTFGEPEKADA